MTSQTQSQLEFFFEKGGRCFEFLFSGQNAVATDTEFDVETADVKRNSFIIHVFDKIQDECRRRTLNRKEQLRHRAVSLRQYGFLVIINYAVFTYILECSM